MSYIAAVDQGTTSTRLIVFSNRGRAVASYQLDVTQHTPQPGWLEHSPEEHVDILRRCISHVADQLKHKQISVSAIKGLGVTNQRETAVLWDRRTGRSVCNAVVWSDARVSALVHEYEKRDGIADVLHRAGLPLTTYFSALKVRWCINELPDVRAVYESGNLCFGNIDSWLIYNLTGRKAHVTDPTNASRTFLMNIQTRAWDPVLVAFFGLEQLILPEIRTCSEVYGEIALAPADGHEGDSAFNGLPVAGCIGDQPSALVGHLGFEQGMAKNTYGTGCFLLYNTGPNFVRSKNGLLTTVAFHFKGHEPAYALEGSVAVAGSVVKWLRNNLQMIETSDQIGHLAANVDDNGGVYFVTAFSGLFAPYWNEHARGTIVGITQFVTKGHICRAAIEATCFQTRAILDCMSRDASVPLKKLRVDGGMSSGDIIMQIQSDVLGMDIVRPKMKEPTALGAAICAGLGVGLWKSLDDLKEHLVDVSEKEIDLFHSKWSKKHQEKQFRKWNRAVERSKDWIHDSDTEDE